MKYHSIKLLLLASWLVCGTGAMFPINAQEPAIPETQPVLKARLTEILQDIGHRATQHPGPLKAEAVLVVAGSLQMVPQVQGIERQFIHLLTALEEKTLDSRFALLGFRLVHGQHNIKVVPWTYDTAAMEKHLSYIHRIWKGDVESGYGLDALLTALNRFTLNPDIVTQFVLITNAPLRTIRPGGGKAKNTVFKQIIDRCRFDNVQLNIIGIPEQEQFELAYQTGGAWYPISNNILETLAYEDANTYRELLMKFGAIGILNSVDADYKRLNMEMDAIFKEIAGHLVENVSDEIDIVFMLDSSRSMENRVTEVCTGIDEMVKILDASAVPYRLGFIRFWAESYGPSIAVVTKPPLEMAEIEALAHRQKIGTEHLLDAIVQSVPKLETPDGRDLVLIIITDEPTTKVHRSGASVAAAMKVCRDAGARVYVLGGLNLGKNLALDTDRFQYRLTVLTGGLHYLIKGAPMFESQFK